jgi:hypothetical protein
MEQERAEFLSRSEGSKSLEREEGTALVVVLVAIAILLPTTLVLTTLALRWQRQSIDLRDLLAEELAADGVFGEARARLASGSGTSGLDIPVGESRSFVPSSASLEGFGIEARISHEKDVVLTLQGQVLEGLAASRVDLEQTGTDAEGRVVYRYRKVEVYLVEVSVRRRATLAPVRLRGIVARLSDGTVQVLGVTRSRLSRS